MSGPDQPEKAVRWLDDPTLHELCDLQALFSKPAAQHGGSLNSTAVPGVDDVDEVTTWILGVVLLHASWNHKCLLTASPHVSHLLQSLTRSVTFGIEARVFCTCLQIDQSEESLRLCIGEDHLPMTHQRPPKEHLPLPPPELPALAIICQDSTMDHAALAYVTGLRPTQIVAAFQLDTPKASRLPLQTALQSSLDRLEIECGGFESRRESIQDALRIFVAGDRSSVGKSSTCLGIMGSLLRRGYIPSQLAYIKPATQSESTQLIELYCKKHGITCVPIGPVVYYRGFTRAFLAGETESTAHLLERVTRAVDRVARGKKAVLIDGVGFPAVGSICGTDNAAVARASGYPLDHSRRGSYYQRRPPGVVLVGGSGVGAAVDAFNLNATYFEQAEVPVMGAIFNKLDLTGYYALDICREQVTAYFRQNAYQVARGREPFGFVPLYAPIAGSQGVDHVEEYLAIFHQQVDVDALHAAAIKIKESTFSALPDDPRNSLVSAEDRPEKRTKLITMNEFSLHHQARSTRSREEIERQAIDSGAAPSA